MFGLKVRPLHPGWSAIVTVLLLFGTPVDAELKAEITFGGGSTTDISGHGNHLTLSNCRMQPCQDKYGGPDCMRVQDSACQAHIVPALAGATYTITFSFFLDKFHGYSIVFGNIHGGACIYEPAISVKSLNSELVLDIAASGCNNGGHIGSFTIVEGRWYSVAVVMDSGTQKVYIDGSYRFSGNFRRETWIRGSYFWWHDFDGRFDSFRYWDEALTANQIALVANRCVFAPCQNGGTCHDGEHTFSCSCAPGFAGSTCATLVTAATTPETTAPTTTATTTAPTTTAPTTTAPTTTATTTAAIETTATTTAPTTTAPTTTAPTTTAPRTSPTTTATTTAAIETTATTTATTTAPTTTTTATSTTAPRTTARTTTAPEAMTLATTATTTDSSAATNTIMVAPNQTTAGAQPHFTNISTSTPKPMHCDAHWPYNSRCQIDKLVLFLVLGPLLTTCMIVLVVVLVRGVRCGRSDQAHPTPWPSHVPGWSRVSMFLRGSSAGGDGPVSQTFVSRTVVAGAGDVVTAIIDIENDGEL